MVNKIIFALFKNMIILQNELLLKTVSEITGISYSILKTKYIKPEYFLPIIEKHYKNK
jgi:hypothetical protein